MDAFLSYPRPKPAVPPEPVPLTRELGIHVPLTPEADEAEMAAWALLELQRNPDTAAVKSAAQPAVTKREQSVEYYRNVARRKREAEQTARRALMRCLAYVEQQLENEERRMKDEESLRQHRDAGSAKTDGNSSLFTLHSSLETLLFRHQQTAEREGGTLFSRWRHCLALVTIRQMQALGQIGNDDDN